MSYSICGYGDAVVDIFGDRHTAYPGGNALNVAAYSKLFLDADAEFIGLLGNDVYGDHVFETLGQIGLARRGVRRIEGETGRTLVQLDSDGDRKFIASNSGGVQSKVALKLCDDDERAFRRADFVHTSVYSGVDHLLRRISDCARVSYDFSDIPNTQIAFPLMRYLECVFFSAAGLTEVEALSSAKESVSQGATAAVVTFGSRGAICVSASGVVEVGIDPVEVVDTIGAGDGFICGFLANWAVNEDPLRALRAGARTGARACSFEGAFGWGTNADPRSVEALQVR